MWVAAGLVVVGGLAPFVFGGTSSRIDYVIIPFWFGAVVLGVCAVLPQQTRGISALLYFVAGLAIVYGLLSMFSLPVRLAVLGTCQAPPAPCTTGLPRPLTNGENTGMGVAATLGILGIMLGFYGLVTVYRRQAVAAPAPPERKIPPVASPAPIAEPEPVAVAASRGEPEREPELPAHEEEELPELPPHESSSATT